MDKRREILKEVAKLDIDSKHFEEELNLALTELNALDLSEEEISESIPYRYNVRMNKNIRKNIAKAIIRAWEEKRQGKNERNN